MNVESAAHASIFVTTSMHSCVRSADAGASIGGGAASIGGGAASIGGGAGLAATTGDAGGVLDEPEPTSELWPHATTIRKSAKRTLRACARFAVRR